MTFSQLTNGSLEDLEAELGRMRAIYTEKHPDIIALKRRVGELKQKGYGTSSRPAIPCRTFPGTGLTYKLGR